ncbi:hypothetical protein EMIT0P253_240079 [Pseudomonas sp. IT-P253]
MISKINDNSINIEKDLNIEYIHIALR